MSKKKSTNYKSKGGNGGKGWKAAAICLALILTAGSALAVFEWATPYKPSNGFKPIGEVKPLPDDPTTGDDPAVNIKADKFFVDNDENESVTEIELLSARIAPEEYAAYGISEQTESAVVISISEIKPTYVIDRTATWSVDFIGQDTEWSAGKSLSDYVKYTVSEDTLSVTVECLQAFGDPIKFTAVMNSNKNLSLSCTCNYLAQVSNVRLAVKSIETQAVGGTAHTVNKLTITNDNFYRYFTEIEYDESVGTVHAELRTNSADSLKMSAGDARAYTQHNVNSGSNRLTTWKISGYFFSNVEAFGNLVNTAAYPGIDAVSVIILYMRDAENIKVGYPPYENKVFKLTQDYDFYYNGEAVSSGEAIGQVGVILSQLKVTDAEISDTEIVFPVVS